MKTQRHEHELRDVLNEFVMSADHPTRELLDQWIRDFPQYERELVEFASVWVSEEMLSEPAELTAEDENLILVRAMSQVENLLFEQEHGSAAASADVIATPVTSLIRSAREAGLNVNGLVDVCRLDRTLLTKLEGRQIRAATIPQRLIQHLAEVLHRSVADIATFLQQPPRIVPGTSFLSHGTPQATSQESFSDAVRSSGLSAEQREYWLAETRNHDPPE